MSSTQSLGHAAGVSGQGTISTKKILLIAGLAMVVLAAAWFGYRWWTAGRFIESTDDAYVGGNVTALAPHVAGFITEIDVEDNQRVHRGELLMKIDDRDFRAGTAHAEAVLHQKRAALADLTAKYALQGTAIRQAAAQLSASQAHASFARDDDRRYQGLMHAVAASRQDVQRAASANQAANADLAGAQAGLASANQQLAVLQADIEQAGADVSQAEADLQTARLNLGYTEIRSPIDGYIGNRAVRVGAYVATGTYLGSITPAQGLWVDANFKEDQLGRMNPGQTATVVADTLPGHDFHGHIVSLAPGTGAVYSVIPPENATGNFTKIVQRVPVRILLDPDQPGLDRLRPGLSVTSDIDTRSGPSQ